MHLAGPPPLEGEIRSPHPAGESVYISHGPLERVACHPATLPAGLFDPR